MKSDRPIFNSDQFTWKGRKGVTEDSTLGHFDAARYNGGPGPGQCSFWIKSSVTGAVLDFYPVFDEDGYDGEMQVFNAFHEDGEIIVTIMND
jgi:hypothetical protein